MVPLQHLIAETPGCSIEPWKFDPSLRKIPPGCPADVAEAARTIYKAHIYETPVPEGTLTKPGSFTFDPEFDHTVAAVTFIDEEQYEDPEIMGFTKCYMLGCFGCGNDQLILDLTDERDPKLRYFYYFPVDPLACYPLLKMSFDAFVRACIDAGPEVRYIRELVDDQM